MLGQPELQRPESFVQEIEPVVRGILRRKLRVTLDPADGRRENQNALELFGDVWVKLLQEPAESIRNARSYAAVIAYHACSEYFRDKYPARSSLRNRLHYFLTHHSRYAVWDHEDGELVGGFAIWRDRGIQPAPSEKLSDLARGQSARPVERMTPADWDSLFDSIFETLAAPVPLDDLVSALAPLVGSVDAVEAEKKEDEEGHRDVLANSPGRDPSPEDRLRLRLLLQRLWIEILQLSSRQRLAYLLNPTGAEIEVFPDNGIASIVEIGQSVALSDGQFDLLAKDLPLELAGTYADRFARVWNCLPLSDKLIGKLLSATPQQVINLRKVARERLGRQMKNFQ